MQYCWGRNERDGTLISGCHFCLCFFLISGIVYTLFRGEYFYIPYFLLLIPFALRFLWVASRKFSVNEEGVTLVYLFGLRKTISWDQFTDVGLYKVHFGSGKDTHTDAIRCVVGGEKFGPRQALSARENWSTDFYEVRHYKKVVSIYNTPERYDLFCKFCPFPIIDYRGLKG